MMNQEQIQQWADYLYDAEVNGIGVQPITELDHQLTIEQAYQVQFFNINRKIDSGQKMIGKKIGLTSLVMQQLLGVDQPDYGHLLDGMRIQNGDTISPNRVIHPRIEGEIAFVLKEDLAGPNCTVSDVLQATDYVVAAIEVADSRIKDWKITFIDTVADNASGGLFIIGNHKVDPRGIDLTTVRMSIKKNGQVINSGQGSAALGHPANGVAWLANKLHEFGSQLYAGEIILTGALSAAVEASPGDGFRVEFDPPFGSVSVQFAKEVL